MITMEKDKEKRQIEFLKSITYTEINEMLNELDNKTKELQEQLAAKEKECELLNEKMKLMTDNILDKFKQLNTPK